MGPIGSGLPQFGFPRLLAMKKMPFRSKYESTAANYKILRFIVRIQLIDALLPAGELEDA